MAIPGSLPRGLGQRGRPQAQDERPLGVADLLDGRRLHEVESADEVEAFRGDIREAHPAGQVRRATEAAEKGAPDRMGRALTSHIGRQISAVFQLESLLL